MQHNEAEMIVGGGEMPPELPMEEVKSEHEMPPKNQPQRIGAYTIPAMDFQPQYQARPDLETLPVHVQQLPLERIPIIPPGMIHHVVTVPEDYDDRQDQVNDLDQEITRDYSCLCKDWFDAVRSFNYYPKSKIDARDVGKDARNDSGETNNDVFTGSSIGRGIGLALNSLFGIRYLKRRKKIAAGEYGVYSDGGCYFLVAGPCYHSLTSFTARWASMEVDGYPPIIPMDDPERLVRTLGSKTIMRVPENHMGVAKCFKNRETLARGNDEFFAKNPLHREKQRPISEEYQSGDTVLIPAGIHVFPEEFYSEVQVINLSAAAGAHEYVNENTLRQQSVTILHVKQGWQGGALHIPSSTYHKLEPGPKYILHEKIWRDIECVRRTPGIVEMGEIVFVNPGEGEMGVARHRKGGYQILPSGEMYQFHKQDWSHFEIKPRTNDFKLGSYQFLTVPRGYIATVQQKSTGLYLILEPGYTYQMSSDEFYQAEMKLRGSHEVTCGPYTVVALQPGMLTGAYRHDNGEFEIFTDRTKLHWLHSDEYHSLQTVKEVDPQNVRPFGPYQLMTIPAGYVGVLDNSRPEKGEESLEIKVPGTYRVEPHYSIRAAIPTMNQPTSMQKNFRTKEQIEMMVLARMDWHVSDPSKTATLRMTFEQLQERVKLVTEQTLIKGLVVYNRDRLMPTEQDILRNSTEALTPEEVKDLVKKADESRDVLVKELTTSAHETIQRLADSSSWGVTVTNVEWMGFDILNGKTKEALEKLAQTQLMIQAERAEAKRDMAKTQAEKEAATKRAEAEASVAMKKAQATKAVDLERAEAKAAVAEREAQAQAVVTRTQAEAAAAVEKITVEMQAAAAKEKALADAEVKKTQANMAAEVKKIQEAAQAEAKAKAEIEAAEAAAKTQELAAAAQAKAEIEAAEAAAKTQELTAAAQAKAIELNAQAEAKAIEMKAEAEAKAIAVTTEAEVSKARQMHEAHAAMPEQELRLKLAGEQVKMMQASDKLTWVDPDAVRRRLQAIPEGSMMPTSAISMMRMVSEGEEPKV